MTGLIYVAIIAVWAIVLVPAWLRRHDHLDPERSVDRFSRAMQTLASNVGDVTVNGNSLQIVALDHTNVSNLAAGNQTKAVQGLSSNNACFKCE